MENTSIHKINKIHNLLFPLSSETNELKKTDKIITTISQKLNEHIINFPITCSCPDFTTILHNLRKQHYNDHESLNLQHILHDGSILFKQARQNKKIALDKHDSRVKKIFNQSDKWIESQKKVECLDGEIHDIDQLITDHIIDPESSLLKRMTQQQRLAIENHCAMDRTLAYIFKKKKTSEDDNLSELSSLLQQSDSDIFDMIGFASQLFLNTEFTGSIVTDKKYNKILHDIVNNIKKIPCLAKFMIFDWANLLEDHLKDIEQGEKSYQEIGIFLSILYLKLHYFCNAHANLLPIFTQIDKSTTNTPI